MFFQNLEDIEKNANSKLRIEKFCLNEEENGVKKNELDDFMYYIRQVNFLLQDTLTHVVFNIASALIDDFSFTKKIFEKFESAFEHFFEAQ